MDNIFIKKIEGLYKEKQFNQIKFEIEKLKESERKNPFILNLQGIIETADKNFKKAKSYFEAALKEDEYYIHSLLNLARISYQDKDFSKIIYLLKKYNKKYKNNSQILLNLADLTFSAGYIEDTINFHKELINTGKFDLKDLSALIFLLNYSINYSEEEYNKYCDLFNEILSKSIKKYNLNKDNYSKVKIAFLSNDLRDHPIGYFLKDFIKSLSKNFSTVAFNLFEGKKNNTDIILELKKSFSEWYDVGNLNNEELSNFIYKKKVLCLFDLSGYNSGNRIGIFKNKPAPIQISWLGYLNSTRIKEIDYLIADPLLIPKEKEIFYSEKIIKLPNIWNAHSILEEININDLPAQKNNYFTFGSFNNFLKISDETINVWNEILNNIPNCRLMLKTLDNVDKDYENYLLNKFNLNSSEKKIFFLKTEKDKNKHLQQYNQIDIVLDTFPYNGVTTSFEAIWMGVPVITLLGNTFASRCGYSINKNLGLDEFIAKSKKDYISKAINFSKHINFNKLNNLRKSLRNKALSSPLFDNNLFVENFTRKINEMINSTKQ